MHGARFKFVINRRQQSYGTWRIFDYQKICRDLKYSLPSIERIRFNRKVDFSVVVPAYRTPDALLKRCIDSILAQKDQYKIEIVIVDSSESPSTHLQSYRDVRFIFPHKRMLAGEARNFGAKQTTAEFLIFLDSDCVWNGGWLHNALAFIKARPNGLAANGLILFENSHPSWALSLHLLEFHEFLSSRSQHQRFLHSGNLLIRRSFFETLGGFMNDWLACEDIALLKAVHNSEKVRNEIYFVPGLSITHLEHLTNPNMIHKKVKFMGYWRGFYDSELPLALQISKKRLLTRSAPLLAIAFFGIILIRSLRLRSIYLASLFWNAPRIFWLSYLWATEFIMGAKHSKNRSTPLNLDSLFPTR